MKKNHLFSNALNQFSNQLATAYMKPDFSESIATLKTSIEKFNNGKKNNHFPNITLDDLYRRGLKDQHLIKIIIWTAEQDDSTTFGRLQALTDCFKIDWNIEVLDRYGNSKTPLNIAECEGAENAAQFIRIMTRQEEHKSSRAYAVSDPDLYDLEFEEDQDFSPRNPQ